MLINRLLSMPRRSKQLLVLGVDVLLVVCATWLAFSLRLGVLHWPQGGQWWVYALAPVLVIPIFVQMGLYRAVFRYSGMSVLRVLCTSVLIYGAVFFTLMFLMAWPDVPKSVGLLQPILLLGMVGGMRFVARQWLSQPSRLQRNKSNAARLVIYGAGSAGVQIAMALSRSHAFRLVAFVDDDDRIQGRIINGAPVWSRDELIAKMEELEVTDLLLAMPSLSRAQRNKILDTLRPLPLHVRSLPDLTDLAQGRIALADIRELDVEDLLGRAPVDPDEVLLGKNLTSRVIMVTGAGGSIGSELCRQILQHKPSRLLLIEHSEFALYTIHQELQKIKTVNKLSCDLVPLLCNVQVERRISDLMQGFKPFAVYHAAAYKHVPLVETNVAEGVANNVLGTLSVARSAFRAQVRHFVLVSTDKAVRPTNVMGATKRMAELVVQALSQEKALSKQNPSDPAGPPVATFPNRTCFSMVRFGNVLGSSGSVVPLFRSQIAEGGPITVTHAEVTRYFMTIPEAVQLVLQAGAMARGGEVFVLDMGDPVKVIDLARRMVDLSGLQVKTPTNPGGDIEIRVTGMRPGEKLYEELLIGDNPQATSHPRIMMARDELVPWTHLESTLNNLRLAVINDDLVTIRTVLKELVHGFQPGELFNDFADSQMLVA
ncbi:MAG: nucleoside-diphosphate sugar epimerase/dehydratase [Hydrogenophaga sp.]|uniref:polysaccharide biosynthesis protein n=1 Tax=Hydrogenophaga sp. TaxID=1904254 RepID=UPI002ABBFBBF|nr:nucleoside-diphosphate sugar epimerase/dehydratase [Hydrogenophaga sp.]MDZ4190347.1 nucleoside-diphosphate sugar epimerase/dehydratase [Hydrogenophaga sp.]